MPVTLLIADVSVSPTFAPPVDTSALAAARTRAQVATHAGSTLEDALLAEFNISADHCALADLMASVDLPTTVTELTAAHCWLRADPVHLAISRDNVQLLDSHAIAPQASEMTAIAETLNAHFEQDNLHFHFPDPARGYLAIDHTRTPQTTPLWRMQGANVFAHMPHSNNATDGAWWRARMNEIQMLLHSHPVNVAREARGQRSINGLWFWGASNNIIAPIKTKHTMLVARLLLARSLATFCAIPLQPITENTQKFDLTNIKLGANTLIVLHMATRELRALSPGSWMEAVSHIDRDWIAPAVAAFDDNKIDALRIIVANESACEELRLQPRNWLSRLCKALQARGKYV